MMVGFASKQASKWLTHLSRFVELTQILGNSTFHGILKNWNTKKMQRSFSFNDKGNHYLQLITIVCVCSLVRSSYREMSEKNLLISSIVLIYSGLCSYKQHVDDILFIWNVMPDASFTWCLSGSLSLLYF